MMTVDQPSRAAHLSAQDLLAGSTLVHEIAVPAEVLAPGSQEPMPSGTVRLRPLTVGKLSLISRAARDDVAQVPVLMIKESLVEPTLAVDQIRQLHIGLVDFLIAHINLISGLTQDGESLPSSAESTLGKTHLLLAKHFGWTPQQVSQLTPAQIGVYLAGIERFLVSDAHKGKGE